MKNLFNKGVTLLESMVAVAILAVVVTGLLYTFVTCLLMNESNNNLIKAANDAQYLLEQVKGLSYPDITNSTLTNLHNETVLYNGTITPVVTEVATNLKEVTVYVAWTEKGRNRYYNLSTRIARVVEEE
ncbi:MAG: prepilin-type N-terminal cleavage/methylation domain-containing protein [Candidatus Omnitrophica bacterium]|nr:prepilin-type N-terminal cleavage/methylation domain-containing protein [Candidatus Omnitrophota bacterium]